MKLFIRTPLIIETYMADSTTPITQVDEMDTLYEDVMANLSKDAKVPKDVLDSFKIKDSLNTDVWIGDNLNPKVRAKLIQIAKDFLKTLEIPNLPKIKDIIFTGSLANFNWSKFSDIDLHIVLDFKEMGEESKFIEDYFYAQKTLWNDEHDISIFNFPVEIYVQDLKAKLEATAVYSVLNDKWILKPKKQEFKLDKGLLKAKAEKIINQLRDIKNDYVNKKFKQVVDKVDFIKDRIRKMRQSGLEKGGEFSTENLLFKVLRRTPFMDYLDSFKHKAYDNLMSVAESLNEDKIWNKGGVLLIKGSIQPDDTQRLYATTTRNLLNLKRIKVDSTEGQPADMAVLGNDVVRITIVDGKLKAHKVAWSNPENMRKQLAIDNKGVVLNNNKTPLHWETLQFNNIGKALSNTSNQILNLQGIKWIG